jgi:AcrR family transcriptional regulator
MAGLRAKQKADRTRRILEAATTLFRQQGYDSARIEDIAEMAEVSVGTLYNYYQNKGDILVATVAMEVTAMAIAIQQPDTPLSRRYTELDGQLSAQVAGLVATLQSRGAVISTVDARAVGEVLFNNLNQMFIEFCKAEAMTLEELKARVAAQHRPVAALISSARIV